MLYADGREEEAQAFLRRALEPDAPEQDRPEIWYLLFDLLRVRADWAQYEALAKRFEACFGTAAPEWLSAEELARLPDELRPGGAGYIEIVRTLDAACDSQCERAWAAARTLPHVHLDLSRIAEIDAEGCRLLADLLRTLSANGTGVLLTGSDRFADLLREVAAGNPAVEHYWLLLLDLYRLQGLQKEFERTAVEYALAAGVKPPEWQPVVMPLPPRLVPQERRDQPRYDPGPEAIHLTGVMQGSTDPQLNELQQFAAGRRFVNVDLSQLRRIDFRCGNAFAQLVNGLAAGANVVRLIRPNALVAAFLAALNLDGRITVLRSDRPR